MQGYLNEASPERAAPGVLPVIAYEFSTLTEPPPTLASSHPPRRPSGLPTWVSSGGVHETGTWCLSCFKVRTLECIIQQLEYSLLGR